MSSGCRTVRRSDRGADRLARGSAFLPLPGPACGRFRRWSDTVAEVTNAAEKLGLHAAAATGHYLLSVLHQEAGDTGKAEASTLRAAAAGRAADETTRAHQLANTARCLLELETEIGRARDLIREATAIAAPRRTGALRAALGARTASSMGRRGRNSRGIACPRTGPGARGRRSLARVQVPDLARHDRAGTGPLCRDAGAMRGTEGRGRPAGRGRNAIRRNVAGAWRRWPRRALQR